MYPYDFKPSREWPIHDLVFVAMPFQKEYDWIYDKIIQPAVEDDCKLKVWRADKAKGATTTIGWYNILENLFSAKLTIGVLSGHNANVYYELGIAHSIHPIDSQLLLVGEDEHFTSKFDLQHLTYISYSKNKIEKSREKLTDAINNNIKYSETLYETIIREALKWLTPLEVKEICGILQISNKSHFTVIENDNLLQQIIVHGLFQKKLLRLSLNIQRNDTVVNSEHSIYWTELGLHVLFALQLIDENKRVQWIHEYREHEAAGNFLVSPALTGTKSKERP